MAALEHNLVFQSLSSSPHARLLRGAELGDELAAALWSNHHDARDYQGPSPRSTMAALPSMASNHGALAVR